MRDLKFRMVTQTTGKFLGYVDIYDLLRNGSDVLPDLEEAMLEGVKFEQDTGLTDKNGKEIYEGDIVKFDNYGDEEISEVYFNGACAGYCTHIVDDHDGDYLPFTRGRDVEVIDKSSMV